MKLNYKRTILVGFAFFLISAFWQARTGAVVYPYWENALRYAEDHAALLAVVVMLTALCPCISLIIVTVRGILTLWRLIRQEVPRRLREAIERSREKRYTRLEMMDREGE